MSKLIPDTQNQTDLKDVKDYLGAIPPSSDMKLDIQAARETFKLLAELSTEVMANGQHFEPSLDGDLPDSAMLMIHK